MTDFLNWRTDPLLVDPEPLVQNTWLTANDLLESDLRDSFIISIGQLLLYPIIIRKNDFITGERILQSFPYINLDKNWLVKIRKQSLALAEKTHYYFQKSNYNRTIRDWQKKINNYLEEQQRLPFPLFRLVPSYEKFFQEKQAVNFQSARGEDFQLPLYLTENLAYLTGVIMGDGHLAGYFINIIDSCKEHIENLTRLLSQLFHSKTEFFEQPNANAWNVNILGKWLVRFFNFLSGQPINARKYPTLCEPLIFQTNDHFRSAFWRGLMDADGSYKTNISFGTASQRLLNDFSNFLSEHNFQQRFYTQSVFGGTTYSLIVAGEFRKQFAQLVGSNHPQKQRELQSLLSRKVNRFSPRVHTLRKLGTWNGQTIGFNKDLLLDGVFDFSSFDFNIIGLGDYFRNLRLSQNDSQITLASKLKIDQGILSKYESNIVSIPISIIQLILTFYQIPLVSLLSENSKLAFQSSRSSCHFPTKPSKKLLNLMKGLQYKENGFLFVIGQPSIPLDDYLCELAKFFAIKIPPTMKIHNSILYTFFEDLFLLKK